METTTPHTALPAAPPANLSVPPVVATPTRVSWGAIFAGATVSIGSWLLLHLVGMAVGLTAVETDDPSSLRAIGIGTGIWTVIAPLIALFLGGMVTARLTGFLSRPLSAIHGSVVWALTMMLGAFFAMQLIGTVVGGVTRVGGAAISGTASAAASAMGVVGTDTMSALGIDEKDLIEPVNQRLRAAGKPEITAGQLRAAVQDAVSTAVRTGELDREALVDSIASKTALSRQDATEVATQVQARFDARRGQLQDRAEAIGSGAQDAALKAADTTGKALGWLSLALALGLAAAVAGSVLGASRTNLRTHTPPHARVHAE